jgi:hypothetical protein
MALVIVKINLEDRNKDTVVYRTNNYDEAWKYVHGHKDENLKIFDTSLNKKYK